CTTKHINKLDPYFRIELKCSAGARVPYRAATRKPASLAVARQETKRGQEDSCPVGSYSPRLRRSVAITTLNGPGVKWRSRSIGKPSGPRADSSSESTKYPHSSSMPQT